MGNDDSKQLVKGAIILAGAGLIGKILGASYRIPLQNLLGDEGFYIYQQIYPILGFALMLSLYGFPSAVAKVAGRFEEEGQVAGWRNFYMRAWLVLMIVCIGAWALLFGCSGLLASVIGDGKLRPLYESASFVFLAIPFTALLRGMCKVKADMVPVAKSQLAEQVIRVAIIIGSAAFIGKGVGSLYKIGTAASTAALFGAACAVLILVNHFRKNPLRITASSSYFRWRQHAAALLGIGLVATLNHALLLIIQLGDMLTMLPGLRQFGLSFADAITAKGIFDRGQPLIQIGSVLGSALALSVMPAISQKKLDEEPGIYGPFMRIALKLSIAIGTGATLGLIFIFPETNQLLFEDDAGTGALRILMVAVLISSVAITMAAMLQGLGFYRRTAYWILTCFVLKVVLNILLVPLLGITGGAFATVLALLFLLVLAGRDLVKRAKVVFNNSMHQVKALAVASICMLVFLSLGKMVLTTLLIQSRLLLLGEVFLLVTGGAIVFLWMLIRWSRFFTDEELLMLPGSRIFMKIRNNK